MEHLENFGDEFVSHFGKALGSTFAGERRVAIEVRLSPSFGPRMGKNKVNTYRLA